MLVSSYGIEKLKTIGDAYMAVAGIPEPIAEHAVKTVKAAIKMRRDKTPNAKGYGQENQPGISD